MQPRVEQSGNLTRNTEYGSVTKRKIIQQCRSAVKEFEKTRRNIAPLHITLGMHSLPTHALRNRWGPIAVASHLPHTA